MNIQSIARRISGETGIVLFLLIIGIFVRLVHLPQYAYFIYDQGRDALKLKHIVEGDLTLIGPTSGLPGFFLGPVWYYAGVPGYLLFQGSPYGLVQWYVWIACLALPFYWLIVKKLWPSSILKRLAVFALLVFLPGSVKNSTFIWNPLLSLPLMAFGTFALLCARNSRWWLFFGFLSLGLIFQSEFAYAIFLVPVMWLGIKWWRGKFSLVDYLIGALAVSLQFLPQLLFEIKNNWLMTKSLWVGIQSGNNSVSWIDLWLRRPGQLVGAFQDLIFGGVQGHQFFLWIVIAAFLLGAWLVWSLRSKKSETWIWHLIVIMAIGPLLGFMLWRGNYGIFFNYYLTPHFLPIVLLVVKGAEYIAELLKKIPWSELKIHEKFPLVGWSVLIVFSCISMSGSVLWPENNAGLRVIDIAMETVIGWQQADISAVAASGSAKFSSSITTYTPNFLTEQYDFVMQWKMRQKNLPVPYTVARSDDALVYTIIEPDWQIPEVRFKPWYEKVSDGRVLLRRKKVGILWIETWVKPEFAKANGFSALYEQPIKDKMGWW